MTKPRLDYLTGFRALAACLVLFGHSLDKAFSYKGISFLHEYAAIFAYLGMSLFFVLSGFVITYNYYDLFKNNPWSVAFKRFAAARFARLYPLYIFVFLLQFYYTVPFLFLGTKSEIASYVTLTQSWFNFQSILFAPAWSVSTEWFFYTAFAVMMAVTLPHRMHESKCIQSAMGIFIVLFTLWLLWLFTFKPSIIAALFPYLAHRYNQDIWEWVSYYSPYTRIGEFLVGALTARLLMLKREQRSYPYTRLIYLCCFGGIVVLGVYNATHFGHDTFLFFLTTNFAFAPLLAWLIYACGRYPGKMTGFLSKKPILAMGEMSYSIYLMQFMVFGPVSLILPQASWSAPSFREGFVLSLNAAVFMVVTLVIAAITYRFIEIPSRKWIRNMLGVS